MRDYLRGLDYLTRAQTLSRLASGRLLADLTALVWALVHVCVAVTRLIAVLTGGS
uniref:Uncharacterized protein n=1 Tax=Phaselicystis flava TaxID=525924 RepID=A0A3S5GYF8_9BACT|nr:hypothetical protein [Phaselicystis flava]